MISPLSYYAETCQVEYLTAIEWTTAADGSPIGYDDGAQYDAIRSTITARLSPQDVLAMLDDIRANGGVTTLQGSGYLLGPTINTAPGVSVRIMDFTQDQPADATQGLIDCTAVLHYGPLQEPSGGSLERVLGVGVPYSGGDLGNEFFQMESGESAAVVKTAQVARFCKWYSSGLSTHEAALAVEGLRTVRAGLTTWTPAAIAYPFGYGIAGPHPVWIPRWTCVRDYNLSWSFEMEIFRNG